MSKYYIGDIMVCDEFLSHHGIKGMKWGVRRFQNEDGTLKPEGVRRYREEGGRGKKLFDAAAKLATGGLYGWRKQVKTKRELGLGKNIFTVSGNKQYYIDRYNNSKDAERRATKSAAKLEKKASKLEAKSQKKGLSEKQAKKLEEYTKEAKKYRALGEQMMRDQEKIKANATAYSKLSTDKKIRMGEVAFGAQLVQGLKMSAVAAIPVVNVMTAVKATRDARKQLEENVYLNLTPEPSTKRKKLS